MVHRAYTLEVEVWSPNQKERRRPPGAMTEFKKGVQFPILTEAEHSAKVLRRYKGATDPKAALFGAIMEKAQAIEDALEAGNPLGIWKHARTNLFIIEHVTADVLVKALKTKVPEEKPTAAALEKIADCVIDALPDDHFFSKNGDDGKADKKRAANKWLAKIEPSDEHDDTECYEVSLYIHSLCIEYLRREGDLTRSAQLSCSVSRDNRFLSHDENAFRPSLSETSGGVCATAMFSY